MGAGDHQHGHRPHDGVVDAPGEQPGHERHGSRRGGHVEQDRREAIGEHLGAAAAGLGVGDEALDPRQRRVIADGDHPNPQRRVRRDRAGDDAISRRLGDGSRLPGDHRLVQFGGALFDDAVGGYSAAGPHEDDVTDCQRVEGDVADVVSLDQFGVVGEQLGEDRDGAAGLADRLHLLPVAEQHDRDEQGQLPPELEVEPVQAGGHRCRVGDGDRHRDEQHHPRLVAADLGNAAGKERPAAPPEHG